MWKKSSCSWGVSLLLVLAASGCGESAGEDGQNGLPGANGLNSLVDSQEVDPGELCEWGGVRILSGLDMDADGALSAEEVQSESLVCFAPGETGADGQDGSNSLIALTDEAPGATCAQGGVRVDVGVDADNDGELQAEEISASRIVCDGEQGQDGQDGQDGLNSLIELREAPLDRCTYGGTLFQVGRDLNANAILDADEVEQEELECDAAVVTELAFPSGDTLANSAAGSGVTLGENTLQDFFLTSHTIYQTFSADEPHVVVSVFYDIQVLDQTFNSNICQVGTLSFEVLLNGTRIDTFSFEGGGGQTVQIQKQAEFSPQLLDGDYTLRIRPLNNVCIGGRSYRWLPGGTFVLNG